MVIWMLLGSMGSSMMARMRYSCRFLMNWLNIRSSWCGSILDIVV